MQALSAPRACCLARAASKETVPKTFRPLFSTEAAGDPSPPLTKRERVGFPLLLISIAHRTRELVNAYFSCAQDDHGTQGLQSTVINSDGEEISALIFHTHALIIAVIDCFSTA